MSDLIEVSNRDFPPSPIQKLVGTRYLRSSNRHKPDAVERAWDRFREHILRMAQGKDQLS